MSDTGWERLDAERQELIERAEKFADLGLGTHAEKLKAGGGAPARLTRTPMIVDTDAGGDPDDAIALVLAARLVPELALVVTGDEVGGQRARFVRFLLDLAGRPEVPVVAGRAIGDPAGFCVEGLTPTEVPAQPDDVHAAVAGVVAAAAATDTAAATANAAVRWVGMGPLSNLADLLAERPALAGTLVVTQMGGALRYRDPTRAEHNFRRDPAAVHSVLSVLPRLRLVTSDVTFTPEMELDAGSPAYRWFTDPAAPDWAGLLGAHLRRWFVRAHPGTMQHDALALSVAMQLPFVDFDLMPVRLTEDARMATGPGGATVFVSQRARYPEFLRWLHRGLAVPDPAELPGTPA